MSNPNSPLTRFRWWLSHLAEPHPDAGDTWCMNCSLNGGQTKILTADGSAGHAREHVNGHPGPRGLTGETITILVTETWGHAMEDSGDD